MDERMVVGQADRQTDRNSSLIKYRGVARRRPGSTGFNIFPLVFRLNG